MSCSLRRLPFVPNEQRSSDPHPPPRGILSAAQTGYHSTAIAWGESIMTLLLKFDYPGACPHRARSRSRTARRAEVELIAHR